MDDVLLAVGAIVAILVGVFVHVIAWEWIMKGGGLPRRKPREVSDDLLDRHDH